MFHIKATNTDGTPPSLATNLFRAVMLYGAYLSAIFSLAILFDNYQTYEALNTPFSFLTSLVVFTAFIMVLARNDNRGIHDLVARTYVVNETTENSYGDHTSQNKKEDPFEFDYDTWDDER